MENQACAVRAFIGVGNADLRRFYLLAKRIMRMKSAHLISLLVLGAVGCSSTRTVVVKVPPRMVLDHSQAIGIVRFDVAGARGEDQILTARFIEAIQHAQPGVPIVELGSSSEVLNGVGKGQLNGEALQEIGKKFNVDSVIVGSAELKQSQPKVHMDLNHGLQLKFAAGASPAGWPAGRQNRRHRAWGIGLDWLQLALDKSRAGQWNRSGSGFH